MIKFIICQFLFSTALLISTFAVTAQTLNLSTDAVQRVEKRTREILLKPYLRNGSCEETKDFQNWQGISLELCDYTRPKDKTGLIKHARVAVHIPTANQLARWVVATCFIVNGSVTTKCTNELVNRVEQQSGGQFPVSGIVFEDMDEDKYENVWNFRDGVTVVFEKGSNNDSKEQPSNEQIESALTGKILRTGKNGYARIVGTIREEYISSCQVDNNCLPDTQKIGTTAERKVEWVNVVRQLYQNALENDRNELMIAWARNNKAALK